MWLYVQASGELYAGDGELVAVGYAGSGQGKNNPGMQTVHNVGPIPCGRYTIEAPIHTVTHGPYVLGLSPARRNAMFGRSAFLLHGDSVVHPGTASEGCIILPRVVRERVWTSGDHQLLVIPTREAIPV